MTFQQSTEVFLLYALEPFITLHEGAKLSSCSRAWSKHKFPHPPSWQEITNAFPDAAFGPTLCFPLPITENTPLFLLLEPEKARLCYSGTSTKVWEPINFDVDVSDALDRRRFKLNNLKSCVETFICSMLNQAEHIIMTSSEVDADVKANLSTILHDSISYLRESAELRKILALPILP
jgi:hypothetical protein